MTIANDKDYPIAVYVAGRKDPIRILNPGDICAISLSRKLEKTVTIEKWSVLGMLRRNP